MERREYALEPGHHHGQPRQKQRKHQKPQRQPVHDKGQLEVELRRICCIDSASTANPALIAPPTFRRYLFSLKLKSAFAVPFGSIVTVIVCSPIFSCTTASVYVPGGNPVRLKCPFVSVTAKNGVADTLMNAFIQGWLLHRTGIITSGWLNCFVWGAPFAPCDMSIGWLPPAVGNVWMLCIVLSELRNSTEPPRITAITCGTYLQPIWSITTGAGIGPT